MVNQALVVVVLTLALAACGPPASPVAAPAPSSSPEGPLMFQAVTSGQVARYDQRQAALAVLPDAAALRQWWSQAIRSGNADSTVQAVDFGKEIAVAVLQGQRVTGGHGIEVREVRRQGGRIVVVVNQRSPSRGGLLTQVITSPYQVVKVEVAGALDWRTRRFVMQDAAGSVLAEAGVTGGP